MSLADAACVADPDLFAHSTGPKVQEALRICRHCPVAQKCVEITEADVANGLPPVSMVQAGVVWSDDGRPHRPRTPPPLPPGPHPQVKGLTATLVEVLGMIAQGDRFSVIASRRRVSVDTVKTQARKLYQVLGAENRKDAVQIALQLGILPPGSVDASHLRDETAQVRQ